MILYVDVDNTLTDPIESGWTPDEGYDHWEDMPGEDWICPPKPEMVEQLHRWMGEGHTVVIWSCRTNPSVMHTDLSTEELIEKLRTWLDHHRVPYDGIEPRPKPFFTYLVDDRAANPAVDADLLLLRYSRMKRYVEHDDDCGAQKLLEPYEEDDLCTCGLSDLLNEDWAAGLKGSIRNGRPDL